MVGRGGKEVGSTSEPDVCIYSACCHANVFQLDIKICAWACLMFFALQLDRGNIVQALSDNMLGMVLCVLHVNGAHLLKLGDLGLTTNDYNNGMTIFYISFLCAELPS